MLQAVSMRTATSLKKPHSYLPFVITEEDPVKFSIKNKTHILASRCIVSKLYKVKSNMYKKKIV